MSPLPFDPIHEAARQWDSHWGPEPVPAMAAVTSIMRAQQILLARLNTMLAGFELTFARYEALMVVYYSHAGELPLGKLSERLQVHKASVTNVIDKLVACGYVERVSHESDGRTVLARITATGRQTAAAATAALNDNRFGLQDLAPEVCEQLFTLLEPLRRGSGDYIAAEAGPRTTAVVTPEA